MADARGVFGLRISYRKKILNQWVPLNDVWISPSPGGFNPNTGYFGGGFPGPRSTMDKVTYSNDTTAQIPGASLSGVRYSLAATGSSTAGYFGGGFDATVSQRSTMDKVTYSSDTTAAVPGAFLSGVRYGLAATGNSTAGYFGGGNIAPGAGFATATMDKVTYSSDTTAAVPGAFLSVARYGLAATGNSTAGYFGGGFLSPGPRSTMDKVTYSTDTRTTVPGASLSVARYSLAASSAVANALPFFNPAPADPPTRFSDGAGPSPEAQPPAATPTPQTYNGSPINV